MSENNPPDAFWNRPAQEDTELERQAEQLREEHLLLDRREPWEIDAYALDPMYDLDRKFWLMAVVLGGLVMMAAATWGFQSS